MRTITVSPAELRGRSHQSADGAIGFARTYNEQHRLANEHLVLGKRISWVEYSDQTLALGTEGGAILSLGIADDGVVTHEVLATKAVHLAPTSEALVLKFPSGAGVVTWDRAGLARALTGEVLRAIFVTPDDLFLYVSQSQAEIIIAVSTLRHDVGATFILYWDVSD